MTSDTVGMKHIWFKRFGTAILAWILGGATFGMLPVLFNAASGERLQNMIGGFSTIGIWAFYRAGAAIFRFPKPKGRMHVTINIVWSLFAYFFVGGIVVAAIGHPSFAAAIVGLPVAIVFYYLLTQQHDRNSVIRHPGGAENQHRR